MPYLVAMAIIAIASVLATFSFLSSETTSEKYENSVLESQWSTIDRTLITSPKIIHNNVGSRNYLILAELYDGELLLTLLNPEDKKSLRIFPSTKYRPSLAAIELVKSTPQANAEVVQKLVAVSK